MNIFKTAYPSEGNKLSPPNDNVITFPLHFMDQFCWSNKSIEQMGDVRYEGQLRVDNSSFKFLAYWVCAATVKGIQG
jgi:hypothetical protein